MPSVGMERSSNLVHHHYRMEHDDQRCECCPYGYHIDLDFVPFTKKMLSREGDVERLQELKDKWRSERQSMDKLLGVDAIAPKIWDVNATISRASTDVWRSVKSAFEREEAKRSSSNKSGTGTSNSTTVTTTWRSSSSSNKATPTSTTTTTTTTSAITGSNTDLEEGSSEHLFENGLSEAVTDFEEALLRTRPQSKILSYEIPDTQKFHTFPRIKAASALRDPILSSFPGSVDVAAGNVNAHGNNASSSSSSNLFSHHHHHHHHRRGGGSSTSGSTSVSTVIMKDATKFSSASTVKKSDDSLLGEVDSIYSRTSQQREQDESREVSVRIREMEEQLKRLPELEVKVTLLTEEKRQLMKLLDVEKQKVASAKQSATFDSGDGTSPPAVPPRRRMKDASVSAHVVTREVGTSCAPPRTRSIAIGGNSDMSLWDRSLRGDSTSPTGSSCGTLNRRRVRNFEIGVQVSDYELGDPKSREVPVLQIVERVDFAVQTLALEDEHRRSSSSPVLKSKSLGTQVKPTVRDSGVSPSSQETIAKTTRSSGVNTEKPRMYNVGCNTTVIKEPTEFKQVASFSSNEIRKTAGLAKSSPQLERRLSSEDDIGATSKRYTSRLSPTRTLRSSLSPTRASPGDGSAVESSKISNDDALSDRRTNLFSRSSPPKSLDTEVSSSSSGGTTNKITSSSTSTATSIARPGSLSNASSPDAKIQSRIPRYQSSPLSSPVASGAKSISQGNSGIPSVSPDRSMSPMDPSPLSSSSSSISSAGSSPMSSGKPMYHRSDTYTKEISHVPERQPLGLMRTLEPLEEEDREGPRSSSASSSSSIRPNAHHSKEGHLAERIKHNPTTEMQAALKVLNDALIRGKTTDQVTSAISVILHEWFMVAGTKSANAGQVEDYIDSFEVYSPQLLRYVVNMPDGNGNTALHYSVSHGNFDVVSILLDSKVCDPNKANKAGYTCIMLVALARIENDAHRQVVRRLFSLGDVNIKAAQHGQTALMLGASHGRFDTVRLLIEAGADLNIQDEDGSTALMCAAEHGHIQIAQFLVAQPECDLHITDNDGSTAFTIAMEGGHKDLGVLLYAQMHFRSSASPTGSSNPAQKSRSTTPSSRASTSNSSSANTSPISSVRRMNTS